MKTTHPLQSKQWAIFREKTGVKVVKLKDFFITIHKIPHTKYTIGYLPKGPDINLKLIKDLTEIGKKENCIFIQIEPNIKSKKIKNYNFKNLKPSAHPLFTKYNFILDITKSEEELLKNMHPKTRYNIKIAQKKGVKIFEDNSQKAFNEYLRLTDETTKRQKFYAHDKKYHQLMWETLKYSKDKTKDELTAHLFKAEYKGETLVTWIIFVLGDSLYYPYGASSKKYKEAMASNLMMWEVIKFGKRLGLKKFDMWGALGENPDPNDPWYGFHKFKKGYGPTLVEYIGSYDLIIKKNLYYIYKVLNKIRWLFLRIK
jgi:lipid II:glycine glycyltransferase (peptidoglycan interpeptide bridge formation enzyme)